MHVYTVNNLSHQPFLLSVAKLNCSATTKNLYDLLKSTLIDCGGMDNMEIAKNVVCVGVDRTLIMQGHKIGLYKRSRMIWHPTLFPFIAWPIE